MNLNQNSGGERAAGRMRSRFRMAELALKESLIGLFARHLPPDRTLADFFRSNRQCGSRDRQLIANCVYAVLRTWGWWRPMLSAELREALESGDCRLTFRELGALIFAARFTESGSDEEVEALRSELELPRPAPGTTPLERAKSLLAAFGLEYTPALETLIPEELAALLPESLPAAKLGSWLIRRPPLWLRRRSADDAVLAELEAAHVQVREQPGRPEALAVTGRIDLRRLECYLKGEVEVQDLASQCIGLVADPKPGERWLDPCAGAGGKTLQLAALMQGKGSVISGDVRESALAELRKRVRRAGFQNVMTRLHDGKPWRGLHDCDGVLVDAPCSGSGVWRRNPGGQWTLTAAQVKEFAARQSEILHRFAAAVRQGGRLVYATCSALTPENEAVVEAFLDTHCDFTLDPFVHPLSGESVPGMLRITSAEYDCDTMFAARLRRKPGRA